MKRLFFIIMICTVSEANALSWRDLWVTRDQQAKTWMEKGEFARARDTFERGDWRAAAAYRAEDYQQAATLYDDLKNEDASYNQGNALSYLGQYEQALKAYDKTLKANPNHPDALHNREIIEKLLKKDKQNQDKQNQDKQNQDKQNQDKQNQDKQNQDKQNQDKQNQDKQNQDKQNQDKQNQDKQNQDKQNQDKQNQDKQNQDKQNQDKQNQDKQELKKSGKDDKQSDAEKQKLKEQWLRLVPDDPGGLMREKFMRDHIRRQREWDQ